jgi:hypothetical protein
LELLVTAESRGSLIARIDAHAVRLVSVGSQSPLLKTWGWYQEVVRQQQSDVHGSR